MRRAAGRAGMRRSSLAVAAILLLTAGCADDDPPPRSQASIPEATATPSTTNPDPYAIPAVIDEAYLNRVLAALDAALADALRSSMRERTLTDESVRILRAVYSDEALRDRVNALQEAAEDGFRGYRSSPGAVVTTVNRMISSASSCAFFAVRRNYDQVASNPATDLPQQYVGLRRVNDQAGPSQDNPTGWTIFYDGFPEDRSEPPDPCTSS